MPTEVYLTFLLLRRNRSGQLNLKKMKSHLSMDSVESVLVYFMFSYFLVLCIFVNFINFLHARKGSTKRNNMTIKDLWLALTKM